MNSQHTGQNEQTRPDGNLQTDGTSHGKGMSVATHTNSSAAAVTEPATVQDWVAAQRQQKLQIAQLSGPQTARRGAELIAMLEAASAKIDRFGWDNMNAAMKNALRSDWCDVLSQYTLEEVRQGITALFRESGGRLRSINEFQVEAMIRRAQREMLSKLPNAPAQDPVPIKVVSPERAAEIAKQAGVAWPIAATARKMGDD